MSEFFEPQKPYDSLDKTEIFHLFQKARSNEKSLILNNSNLQNRISRLQVLVKELKQGNLDLTEALMLKQAAQFGKSSERSTKEEIAASSIQAPIIPGASDPGNGDATTIRTKRVLKSSVRYPSAEVRENHILPASTPMCPCCSGEMRDSGLTETSERLTVVPKKFIIERQIRHKFRCDHCQGAIVTAALPPSLVPGGAYGDELTIDLAVAKYCDLMPIQRYIKAAERAGIMNLPSQSLIESTHALALAVRGVYRKLKQEILASRVLHADETPHRMLEGDDRDHWYFWGFTNNTAAYFEARDTRSGDVASEFLRQSLCEYLTSDVYSGYAKAVRETNEYRAQEKLLLISNVYCNSHGRRYFHKAKDPYADEAKYFLDRYRAIFFLESQLVALRTKDPNMPVKDILEIRAKMKTFFEEMKARAEQVQINFSSKSSIAKAMAYFLRNYVGLILFVSHAELPIDNNPAERILRNPVIGRKSWYGTHSPQGADTAAVLFSIVESCKLNRISANAYLSRLIRALHSGEPLFTPFTYATRPELRA